MTTSKESTPFKVGDVVTCVRDAHVSHRIVAGEEYIITELETNAIAPDFVKVRGVDTYFLASRFEKCAEEEPIKYIVVSQDISGKILRRRYGIAYFDTPEEAKEAAKEQYIDGTRLTIMAVQHVCTGRVGSQTIKEFVDEATE